jgi:hypothetical protein
MHCIEVQRDRGDHRRGVEGDERKRGRREWAVGFDAIAGNEREADPEEQIDQGDNENDAGPPR